MPLSVFDGAASEQVHEQYDAEGTLLSRTVVTVPSPWTADDRAWALGLALREAAECRRCGGNLAETTDKRYAWRPAPPTVCFRCVALAASEKDQAKHPFRAGLMHHVTKVLKPNRGERA